MKKLLYGLIIGWFLIIAVAILPKNVSSSGGSIYLDPASKTVTQGTNFPVAIRVSSGTDKITAVAVNLSYDPNKLDYISIDASGSAFDWQVGNPTGGGGLVTITRGILNAPGYVTGNNLLVATVFFRPKQSSGSASITFTDTKGSGLVGPGPTDTATVISGGTGGNYTFAAQPTTPTNPSNPSHPSQPSQPSQPATPPDTTAPKISGVEVAATSFNGATIEWKTDEPSTSVIEYGVNNAYGLTADSPGLTKDHKVVFASALLIPGEVYHFRVKSADAAGNALAAQDSTFTSRGIPVKIKVVDTNGKVIKGAEVTLASAPVTAKTGKDGIATFADVTPGTHLVSTKAGGTIQAFQIEVKAATAQEVAAGAAKPQSFEVKVLPTTNKLTRYLLATVAGLLVIVIGVSFLLWYRSKKKPI